MKTLINDGITYNLVPVQAEEPLICTMDGYNYYLGPEAPEMMYWYEAVGWCKSLGVEYELPDRVVLLAAVCNSELQTEFGVTTKTFWSSSEYRYAAAWAQHWNTSSPGVQDFYTKTLRNNVRAVRKSII